MASLCAFSCRISSFLDVNLLAHTVHGQCLSVNGFAGWQIFLIIGGGIGASKVAKSGRIWAAGGGIGASGEDLYDFDAYFGQKAGCPSDGISESNLKK